MLQELVNGNFGWLIKLPLCERDNLGAVFISSDALSCCPVVNTPSKAFWEPIRWTNFVSRKSIRIYSIDMNVCMCVLVGTSVQQKHIIHLNHCQQKIKVEITSTSFSINCSDIWILHKKKIKGYNKNLVAQSLHQNSFWKMERKIMYNRLYSNSWEPDFVRNW